MLTEDQEQCKWLGEASPEEQQMSTKFLLLGNCFSATLMILSGKTMICLLILFLRLLKEEYQKICCHSSCSIVAAVLATAMRKHNQITREKSRNSYKR